MNKHYVAPILQNDEPNPVSIFNIDGKSPFLLLCEHASNRLPIKLNRLGLDEAELQRHIGWDIGVF